MFSEKYAVLTFETPSAEDLNYKKDENDAWWDHSFFYSLVKPIASYLAYRGIYVGCNVKWLIQQKQIKPVEGNQTFTKVRDEIYDRLHQMNTEHSVVNVITITADLNFIYVLVEFVEFDK